MRWGETWAGAAGFSSIGPCVREYGPALDENISRGDAITFSVRGLGALVLRVLVHIPGQGSETAFDGLTFGPLYQRSSLRTYLEQQDPVDLSEGWRFSVKRLGGWPGTFRIEIQGTDEHGNTVYVGGSPVQLGIPA